MSGVLESFIDSETEVSCHTDVQTGGCFAFLTIHKIVKKVRHLAQHFLSFCMSTLQYKSDCSAYYYIIEMC